MKFTAQCDALLSALQSVQARARYASGIPILKCVRIDARDGRLHLLGHDIDSCSEAECAADVEALGVVATPFENLSRLLKSLPKEAHVILADTGQAVELKSGRSRYQLRRLPPEDFPAALAPERPVIINLDKAAVGELFSRAAFALDPDDPRFFTKGVLLSAIGGKLWATATDGRQIARVPSGILCGDVAPITVPAAALDSIIRIGADGLVLRWSDKLLSVHSTSDKLRRFTTKLLDGEYPDVTRAVIPATGPYIQVNAAEFLECASRLSTADPAAVTRLSWDDEPHRLNLDLCRSALTGHEEIECAQVDMKAGHIGVPCGKLVGIITAARGQVLRLHFQSPTQPWRPVNPEEPETILVQMPIRADAPEARAA